MTLAVKSRISLVLSMLFLFCVSNKANASLILDQASKIDTIDHLFLEWEWFPELPGSDSPSLQFWSSSLSITLDAGIWRINSSSRHVADPHPDLGESGGGTAFSFDFSFEPSLLYGTFAFPGLTRHAPTHYDEYSFTIIRSRDPAQFTKLQVEGTHIPEPSTLQLIGIALIILLFPRARSP